MKITKNVIYEYLYEYVYIWKGSYDPNGKYVETFSPHPSIPGFPVLKNTVLIVTDSEAALLLHFSLIRTKIEAYCKPDQ